MIQCPHCEWPFSTLPELQTHMEVKHNENVPAQLIALYLDMKAFPDDLRKRSIYFEALADARLTDYYGLRDELQAALNAIADARETLLLCDLSPESIATVTDDLTDVLKS